MGQELDPGGSDAMVTDVAPAAQQVYRELGLEASDAIVKTAPDRPTPQPIPPKGKGTVRQDSHANLMVDPARTDLNPKTATDPLLSGYRLIHSASRKTTNVIMQDTCIERRHLSVQVARGRHILWQMFRRF